MPNDPRTNHVREKFEFVAIPDEHDRAGAAAAIDLGDDFVFVCGNFQFVLEHAGWPQQSNHVSAALDAQRLVVVAKFHLGAGHSHWHDLIQI